MKYFNQVKNLEELKKEYRKLCFELHPDRNHGKDTTKEFQEMQNEYEKKFEEVKNIFVNSNGETYTKENTETAKEFEEIINKLVYMIDVDIDIIGNWIWVSGNTKTYKDELKNLKFRWSANKLAWYYHKGSFKKKSKANYNLDELKEMFENTEVEKQLAKQIA